MNPMELMQALTDMDDDVLLRAEQDPPRRRLFPKILRRTVLAYAAVLVLVITATAYVVPFVSDGPPMGWADKYVEQTMYFTRSVAGQKEASCSMTFRHGAEYAEVIIDDQSGQGYKAVLEAVVYRSDGTVGILRDTFEGSGNAVISVNNRVDGLPGTVYLIRVQLLDPINGGMIFQMLHDLDSLGLYPPAGVEITLPPYTFDTTGGTP